MGRLLLALVLHGLAIAAEPLPLFDGTTLAGWDGDTALWRVDDGAIVAGRPGIKQPETVFLVTTKEYGDFELTVQYRSNGMNGGIQVRSQRRPGSQDMIGYQADFFKGGDGNLWDESRRRVVLSGPDAATRAALKLTTWNTYRIRAEGPRIRLWLNDVPTADWTETDAAIPRRGYIGLQLHANAQEIRYRDLRLTDLTPAAAP